MKVVVYTINNCPFCQQEKEYLQSHNILFEEKNMDENHNFLSEMLKLSDNFTGVPFTLIEKNNGQKITLKGFTKEEFDQALDLKIQKQDSQGIPSINQSNVPLNTPSVNLPPALEPSPSATSAPSVSLPTPPSSPISSSVAPPISSSTPSFSFPDKSIEESKPNATTQPAVDPIIPQQQENIPEVKDIDKSVEVSVGTDKAFENKPLSVPTNTASQNPQSNQDVILPKIVATDKPIAEQPIPESPASIKESEHSKLNTASLSSPSAPPTILPSENITEQTSQNLDTDPQLKGILDNLAAMAKDKASKKETTSPSSSLPSVDNASTNQPANLSANQVIDSPIQQPQSPTAPNPANAPLIQSIPDFPKE